MIVVADASVLVAELLRVRGRELLAHPALRVVVAEEQWDETEHELAKLVESIVDRGHLDVEQATLLQDAIRGVIDARVIEVIPRALYAHLEPVALRRVPRVPDDRPVVALALALDAGILTADSDFLGCGVPT